MSAVRDAPAPRHVSPTASLVAAAAVLVVHTTTVGLLIGATAALSMISPAGVSARCVTPVPPTRWPRPDPDFDPLPTNFVNC